ncbi:MAG: helix-turn-helix domain-containing protein [Polyangiaceae bacterium]
MIKPTAQQGAVMNIRYVVVLEEQEVCQLEATVASKETGPQKRRRAQILLAANRGIPDCVIAETLPCGTSTVYRTKKRFVEEGFEASLRELPRQGGKRKLSSKEEAMLSALACSNPPEGSGSWTLQLLADKLVELTDHEELSKDTVRRRLAENKLKPWRKKMWCIPTVDAEFVARMDIVCRLGRESKAVAHGVESSVEVHFA